MKVIIVIALILFAVFFVLDLVLTTQQILKLKGSKTRRTILGALMLLTFVGAWLVNF